MRSKTFKMANQAVMKAGQHAYIDRRKKKRVFRALWIVRLNAALRQRGLKYSTFIKALNDKNIGLNRKVLSEMAISDPAAFDAVCKEVGAKASA